MAISWKLKSNLRNALLAFFLTIFFVFHSISFRIFTGVFEAVIDNTFGDYPVFELVFAVCLLLLYFSLVIGLFASLFSVFLKKDNLKEERKTLLFKAFKVYGVLFLAMFMFDVFLLFDGFVAIMRPIWVKNILFFNKLMILCFGFKGFYILFKDKNIDMKLFVTPLLVVTSFLLLLTVILYLGRIFAVNTSLIEVILILFYLLLIGILLSGKKLGLKKYLYTLLGVIVFCCGFALTSIGQEALQNYKQTLEDSHYYPKIWKGPRGIIVERARSLVKKF